jgi:hypothetical protein
VTVLNEAAGETPHRSVLSWTPGQEPSRHARNSRHSASAAVSAIAEESITLFSQGAHHQLRACLTPRCVLYFLTSSRITPDGSGAPQAAAIAPAPPAATSATARPPSDARAACLTAPARTGTSFAHNPDREST